MTTDTIKSIQKQIVTKLETGQDVSALIEQLAQVRAKIAAQAEVEALQKVAGERQALKARAAALVEKVERQDAAIDRLLVQRDALMSQLEPLLEPMLELARLAAPGWEREPGEIYSAFNDMTQFSAAVRPIPAGYLPSGFGCSFMQSSDGLRPAEGMVAEAYGYFMAVLGLLSHLTKGLSTLPAWPAEGLMALDEREVERTCLACDHPEVEGINSALAEGKSLRDVESEFGVSRSSIQRHKNNCLDLGAIRVSE